MKLSGKNILLISWLGMLTTVLTMSSCESEIQDQLITDTTVQLLGFPTFITPAGTYFETRIADIPVIDGATYELKISGAGLKPTVFSLQELLDLEMVERTLTIECIGNPVNGNLVGTATWKGFRIYDLLESLGIKEGVSTVKYLCADGYFTYNNLEDLQEADVIGALYMNDELIPAKYGFPLRIIFPGYYGVRQPGWIVEMKLLESGIEDYWSQWGWNTDISMAVDSKIFFPENNKTLTVGDSVKIGGAAFGGKRISTVEITVDEGETWIPATIRKSLDEDHVWIFWEANFIPRQPGSLTIHSKATAQDGSTQPWSDNNYLNGTNALPSITISVEEGN